MKKTITSLLLSVLVLSALTAWTQNATDTILQPNQILARTIGSDGTTTREMACDFSYHADGKVQSFLLPDYALTTYFRYNGDYMEQEDTWHRGGHPIVEEVWEYRYNEKGLLSRMGHLWSQLEGDDYWYYTYDDNDRLVRKDLGDIQDRWEHWLYEYEDGGRKRTETYYVTHIIGQDMVMRGRTESEYDEAFNLTSDVVYDYSEQGECVRTTRSLFTYHEDGQLALEEDQLWSDEAWVNTTFTRCLFDDRDRVVERQTGEWNEDTGEWEADHKVVYEYDDSQLQETVSFYKKQDGVWVWDKYRGQPIFPNSKQRWQQNSLRFFNYCVYFGDGNVNQFVIGYIFTSNPIYLDIAEQSETKVDVYPNPGNNLLVVKAPLEATVIRIYDLNGRLVCAQPFDFSTTIHTDAWAKGIYVWEIWDGFSKAYSGKWVKK